MATPWIFLGKKKKKKREKRKEVIVSRCSSPWKRINVLNIWAGFKKQPQTTGSLVWVSILTYVYSQTDKWHGTNLNRLNVNRHPNLSKGPHSKRQREKEKEEKKKKCVSLAYQNTCTIVASLNWAGTVAVAVSAQSRLLSFTIISSARRSQ